MKRSTTVLAALALAACVSAEPPAPPSGAIELHAARAIPADIDAAFAGEIARRYAGAPAQDVALNDLAENGFLCNDLGEYPAVRPGQVLSTCELPRPHGLCSDKWSVALKLAPVTGAVSVHRIAAEGRFARSCIAGASPNG